MSQEIDSTKATKELGIPADILYSWIIAVKERQLDIDSGSHTPENALTLDEELRGPQNIHIPSEHTVYHVMEKIGLVHKPRRKFPDCPKTHYIFEYFI